MARLSASGDIELTDAYPVLRRLTHVGFRKRWLDGRGRATSSTARSAGINRGRRGGFQALSPAGARLAASQTSKKLGSTGLWARISSRVNPWISCGNTSQLSVRRTK